MLAEFVPEAPWSDTIRMASAVHSPTFAADVAGRPDHADDLHRRAAGPWTAAGLRQRDRALGHRLPGLHRGDPLRGPALGLGLAGRRHADRLFRHDRDRARRV